MEIRVKEMNASDEIAIRTQSSDYSFRLIDPVQCRGVLRGGVLGSEQCEAIFAGTTKPGSFEPEVARLERGSRAIFIICRNGVDRLTTSIIQEIELTEVPEPNT